jgi:class 3 adenylate cyclase
MDGSELVVDVEREGKPPLRLIVRAPLVIGRDADGLILDELGVSRRHVEIRPAANGLMVTDLGSTNGTFRDGERLTEAVVLESGSAVTLGHGTIRYVGDVGDVYGPPSTDAESSAEELADLEARRGSTTSIERVANMATDDPGTLVDVLRRGSTVTIMFSDIEASTARATALGDKEWFKILRDHEALIRQMAGRHHGVIVKSLGDGFMLSFESAYNAVVCAIRIQQTAESSDDGHLRVRIGVHTGEAIQLDDGDWIGRHVIEASRIADAADGGEVYTSELVHGLTRAHTDLPFGPPVTRELKGLGPETIRKVEWRTFAD